MATKKYLDQEGLLYLWQQLKAKLATKVDVEEGKSLISTDLITKLEGVAAGAQVNVLEGVQVNGADLTITDKKVNVIVPTKISDLGTVTEADLDAALAEKVNAASEGNHAHLNKDLLDTYTQTEADLADAVAKKHAHANAAELDLIASGDKAKWDAAAADTATIKADYLKTADKYDDTALAGRVKAIEDDYLKEADKYDDTALAGRVKAIEDDYLKAADKYDDTELAGRVTAVEGKVTTMIGEDAGKSVRTIANEELAAQLIAADAKESLDTLAEIAAWIQSHPDDAAAMNEAIVALQNKVDTGDKTVSAYVTDAIAALSIGDYAKAADLTALAARVKAIEDDYLKGADRTALEKAISDGDAATLASAKEYADGLNTAMAARVKAIEDDYVKASELVALETADIDAILAQ